MEPSPTPRETRSPLREASRWFGWSVVAVSAAILLEGAVSTVVPDSYSLMGPGDCLGIGSRSGALAVCAFLGLCAFAYPRRGPRALWASVLLAECLRFVPCLVMVGYVFATIPGARSDVPGLMNSHSAVFWWITLSLTAVLATAWALFRRPGPGVAPLAASALGASTALAACFLLFESNQILPWARMVSAWAHG